MKTMETSDIRMLESCFAYSQLGWSSYYKAIVKKYGKEATEKQVEKIKAEYKVVSGTYEDSEGCVYNSLVKV